MNNQENKNNKQAQDSGKDKATQTSAKSFFAKRWTFPVIYLAASVLIVGLMYAKSQDAAPYEIQKTNEGTSEQAAGPQLPDANAQSVNATPDFMWPVGEGGSTANLTMAFYQENAGEEERAAAVVSYENTFTPHEGVDIGLKSDEPFNVIAAAKGTVKAVKEDPLMGHVVEIDHGNGYTTYYASLSAVEVEEGSNVLAGQTIAKTGNNRFEKSEKNHLHFEMRKDGKAVDPNSILPKKPIGDNAQSTTAPAPAASSTSTEPAAPAEKQDAGKDASTDKDAKPEGDAKSTDTAPSQN